MEDFKEKTHRCQMAAQIQAGKCLSSGSAPHPSFCFNIAVICCLVLLAQVPGDLHDSFEKEVRGLSPEYKHRGFVFEFQSNLV